MTACSITDCSRQGVARNLCMIHYQRVRRAERGPERIVWLNLIQRCTDPNHPRYHRYGGRGITVDDRFLGENGFERFLEEIGHRPPDPKGWAGQRAYWSVDRIDNDRSYEPGNIRWATPSQQALNRQAGYQRVSA